MRSAHSREQDFMAITAEFEVLRQQLKGKGMYTVPPVFPTTSDPKPSNNVHFQPIDPAHKPSVQTMDQSLLNSSLNLLDDSPQLQSSNSNRPIPCGHTTPQGYVHASNIPMYVLLPLASQLIVPLTPYVNQMAVNQHMGTQPAPIPPRMSTSPTNLQPPAKTLSSQVPSNIQLQQLPFVDAPLAPTQDYSVNNTASPSSHDTRSKSTNRQGVKQTLSTTSSASTSMEKSGPICWNCGEAGHLKCNCPNPLYCSKCKQPGHLSVKCPLKAKRKETSQMPQRAQQTPVDQRFSNIRNKCIHCGGDHASGKCPTRTQPQIAPSTAGNTGYNDSTDAGKTNNNASLPFSTKNGQSAAGSTTPSSLVNNSTGTQGRVSCTQAPQVTPQVSPNTSQQNSYNIPPMQPPNQFPPPPYFPIPFPPPPIAPSNVSNGHSAPVSDISAAITLMINAVTQGNLNTTAITNALERTTMQFANALQQTIQMGVHAQAQENKNARMDKQFEKVKVFNGSKPSECHPWLEEVHALCIQTGRPFHKIWLLCAGQAVCYFIVDMSPDAPGDQIKNDPITGYLDLQGLGCKQAAYDNITQRCDEPLKSYIIRYSRLFKLLNGTVLNDVKMRTTAMHFVNSLHSYLRSKVENRLLNMNERNYSLGDAFKVALECELKAIASER